MIFSVRKPKDFYLLDTKVENIFINEYMPAAPGSFTKVYLFGLMYAEYGMDIDDKIFATALNISEKKVAEAWDYWEKAGAVKREFFTRDGRAGVNISYVRLTELMYGKSAESVDDTESSEEQGAGVLGNEVIKKMLEGIESALGRSLSSAELKRIIGWSMDDGIPPELVTFAFEYCISKGKTSVKYIETVVKNWYRDGLRTVDEVNEYLQEVDEKFYRYRRVMKALGFTRQPSEAEKKIMDNWFDNMGFSMDKVLEACGKTTGISSPNFNYVNKVLENWENRAAETGADVNDQQVTMSVLNKYFEHLRAKEEREADARTEEVYRNIPRVKEIDDEVKKIGAQLSKALLMGEDRGSSVERKKKMESLSEERAVILTEHNYEPDYTDVKYLCDKCNDTGITDMGERCTCVPERMKEAAEWAKSTKTS
jgi:DnaD/phage-associated family protein